MVFLARVKKVKRETELQPHTSQTDASQNTMTFRYSPYDAPKNSLNIKNHSKKIQLTLSFAPM